ncbi:MAG: VWA domain-containing protein [Clostridia bacterium]|nr:VWA domain-containing protein [Clostridia bacterium]
MTKQNGRTELIFILDRSGSMHHLTEDTIGGFNSVLESHRKEEGECHVTTILFSHEISLLHDRLPVQAVHPMSRKEYVAGGSTALLDAMGYGIEKIEKVYRALDEQYRPEHVQFVIITDGYENSSEKYTKAMIRSLIDRHQEKDGWDFLFLGANMDAVAEAASLGIQADRAVTAMADDIGMKMQYDAVASASLAFRRSGQRDAEWKAPVEADTKRRGRR